MFGDMLYTSEVVSEVGQIDLAQALGHEERLPLAVAGGRSECLGQPERGGPGGRPIRRRGDELISGRTDPGRALEQLGDQQGQIDQRQHGERGANLS